MSPVPTLVLLACLTSGCATIDYVGDSYQPTTRVEIYFSRSDVPRDYRIIGQVMASGGQFVSASDLQNKMIARAREVGADAVIVLDVSREPMSGERRTVETTTETHDEKKRVTTETVASDPAEETVIRALFIRYR
jgi:hypothetical protein